VTSFLDNTLSPAVRGYLHTPQSPNDHALVLTHGAGGNCNAPLLVALAETFSAHGYTVLRCDLPFRQAKAFGPPFPGQAERDRAGLRNAVAAMRKMLAASADRSVRATQTEATAKIFLGGHSYGGRQATMLCAEEPELVDGLLLLSYPLHPPRTPEKLRTQHLPNLRTPSLFVHGTRDPFGSIAEMTEAIELVPARHELLEIDGAGHDLGFKGKKVLPDLPGQIVARFQGYFSG